MMRYLSVCSGIEAASVAWHQLGWHPAAFSEIEAFPRAVLQHHYPHTPLHGDFTTIQAEQYGAVDLLVGGTPCQSFSVAGLRLGLDDPRGNLALGFVQLAQRTQPRWILWENVPGALSSHGGRDFGAILGAMAELGYGFAYRVLDARYFGVPQKRRRVFLVGHRGDWRPSAAVLFEQPGAGGDSPPAPAQEHHPRPASWWNGGQLSQTLDAVLYKKQALPEKNRFPALLQNGRLRYITPLEAERLQGFPDGWTDVPFKGRPARDSHRYKALGNSMAVPVMAWIGSRIAAVEALDGRQC